MSQNADTNEQTLNSKYLLDFYIKDLKYISPEALGVHKKRRMKKWTYKAVGKVWAVQVVKGFKQLFSQGSLHGMKYMLDPTFSRAERLTWVAIMIVSVAACAGNITQLFLKWTSTPFVNVIDSLPSPVWAVPFPNVVLCPHLHVKLSYRNVNRFDNLEKFFASLVCPQMSKENRALDERMTPQQNLLLEKFILQGAPKCTEVIKSCYWRATSQTWLTEECCAKLFSPVFTNYGLCFAFNSLPLHGMTNVTTAWQRTFSPSVSQKTLDWGLDAGYPKVFPPDPAMEPFRVMASGETNGLGVELYLNDSEHQVACDGASVGFNLIISSPTNHVYTSTIIRLPMDRMTTIEVYPITYRTDSSLKGLLPERRQCFFQDERKLEYFESYTDSNCKLDLLIREARKWCNCVHYNWPKKSPSEPICSTKADFLCINDVKAKVEEQLIYAYFADSEEQRKPTGQSSSCHPACNDVIYNSQVFYSDLKTDPAESPKWGYPGPGEITRLNVHFYDDSFLGQHRHAQYDDYYFVGAIGGLLSLFLGFSIISVAELIYFVLLRPLHAVVTEICHRHRT
ncbi:pickpocket protein 28-like isoform X1 [Cydia pomonella]|uniref:pickpocket protein 28-like isoform X1 n=2 Tax=Cydia pomonella TaxID=82600 RepID=UPI002ADE9221|nr:pickpocket protein 28-like isoform X1 [Cydia pomonella]